MRITNIPLLRRSPPVAALLLALGCDPDTTDATTATTTESKGDLIVLVSGFNSAGEGSAPSKCTTGTVDVFIYDAAGSAAFTPNYSHTCTVGFTTFSYKQEGLDASKKWKVKIKYVSPVGPIEKECPDGGGISLMVDKGVKLWVLVNTIIDGQPTPKCNGVTPLP